MALLKIGGYSNEVTMRQKPSPRPMFYKSKVSLQCRPLAKHGSWDLSVGNDKVSRIPKGIYASCAYPPTSFMV